MTEEEKNNNENNHNENGKKLEENKQEENAYLISYPKIEHPNSLSWCSQKCSCCIPNKKQKCCSCGCLNKMQSCCEPIKNKYNKASKCISVLFKSCVDKYNEKLIIDIFFKIPSDNQQIMNIISRKNKHCDAIYVILEKEYVPKRDKDQEFIREMYNPVIKTFLHSMVCKSVIANTKGNVTKENLDDWGNF